MTKKRKPRFIKPPNTLKKKVGTGGFEEKLVIKSQNFIDKVEVDFIPYAEKFLQDFSAGVREASSSNDNFKYTRDKIIAPIMQLKANGGMFQYPLVSAVADIALQFLESIEPEKVNPETFEVLRAHEKTLKVIIANNLRGHGGREGDALIQELDQVCKRYFSKYRK